MCYNPAVWTSPNRQEAKANKRKQPLKFTIRNSHDWPLLEKYVAQYLCLPALARRLIEATCGARLNPNEFFPCFRFISKQLKIAKQISRQATLLTAELTATNQQQRRATTTGVCSWHPNETAAPRLDTVFGIRNPDMMDVWFRDKHLSPLFGGSKRSSETEISVWSSVLANPPRLWYWMKLTPDYNSCYYCSLLCHDDWMWQQSKCSKTFIPIANFTNICQQSFVSFYKSPSSNHLKQYLSAANNNISTTCQPYNHRPSERSWTTPAMRRCLYEHTHTAP